MGKIRIKKNIKKIFYIILVIGLFLSIGLYSLLKIHNQKKYEQTYEYKLINVGYQEDEVKTILKAYQDKEIEYILTKHKNEYYLDILDEKYFIYDKFYEYLNYLKENLDIPLTKIIETVNTNTHKEYYSETYKTDITKKELMLVNKYYYLDESYEPENLVTVPTTYAWGPAGSQRVTKDTYDAFLNLWADAHEQGYYLMVSSSYRTYEKQEEVYNDYKESRGTEYADSIAARPGFSEHQTGYTLDMFAMGATQKTFHTTEAYSWLKENVHKYGFIIRYPEDKEDVTGYSFESWHYRYIGIEAATYIYENNITFDEYYAYFVK